VVEKIRTHPPFDPDLLESALTCTSLADRRRARVITGSTRWVFAPGTCTEATVRVRWLAPPCLTRCVCIGGVMPSSQQSVGTLTTHSQA
jgi:hypothetical protein